MKDKVYIVLNARGALKMSKKAPALQSGEIFIEVDLTVDNSVFLQLMPKARIEVQADKEPVVVK